MRATEDLYQDQNLEDFDEELYETYSLDANDYYRDQNYTRSRIAASQESFHKAQMCYDAPQTLTCNESSTSAPASRNDASSSFTPNCQQPKLPCYVVPVLYVPRKIIPNAEIAKLSDETVFKNYLRACEEDLLEDEGEFLSYTNSNIDTFIDYNKSVVLDHDCNDYYDGPEQVVLTTSPELSPTQSNRSDRRPKKASKSLVNESDTSARPTKSREFKSVCKCPQLCQSTQTTKSRLNCACVKCQTDLKTTSDQQANKIIGLFGRYHSKTSLTDQSRKNGVKSKTPNAYELAVSVFPIDPQGDILSLFRDFDGSSMNSKKMEFRVTDKPKVSSPKTSSISKNSAAKPGSFIKPKTPNVTLPKTKSKFCGK